MFAFSRLGGSTPRMPLSDPQRSWQVRRTNNFSDQLLQSLHSLQQEAQLTDFTINVQDKSIPVHSPILAANSPYFTALFNSGMREVASREVSFDEFDYQVMKDVVDYMYTGNIVIAWEKVKDVIEICELLQLLDLKDECQRFILAHLTPDNCIHWFKTADRYNMQEARKKIKDVMITSLRSVILSDAFKELSLAELLDYIGDAEIPAVDSDYTLKGALAWTDHDESRQPDFPNIVSHINLEKCSPSYLKYVVENYDKLLIDVNLMKKLVRIAFSKMSSKDVTLKGTPQIVMLGGRNASGELNLACWKYDLTTSKWERFSSLPCTNTTRLQDVKACCVGDILCTVLTYKSYDTYRCEFYTFENFGWTAQPSAPFHNLEKGIVIAGSDRCMFAVCDKDFMCFDMSTSTWEQLPSFPRDVCTGDKELIAVENKVIMMSKSQGSSQIPANLPQYALQQYAQMLNQAGRADDTLLLCYDINCQTWKITPIQPQESRSQASFTRCKGKLYLSGGEGNICFSYDPESNVWTKLNGPSTGRWNAASVAVEDKIYLMGGIIGSFAATVTDQIEVYDVKEDKWMMSHIRLPSPFVGHEVVSLDLSQ